MLDIGIGVRLKDFSLHRPRQWGTCCLACELYRQLGLDGFWSEELPPGNRAKTKTIIGPQMLNFE